MAAAAGTRHRREQILAAATDLFAARGLDGTSIRAIASACGITEAAIYRHFESKHDLYEEVIRAKAGEHDIAGHLARHAGRESVEDALSVVADHVLSLVASDPALIRLMFHTSFERGAAGAVLFREVRLPYVEYLARELAGRVAAGEIGSLDPTIPARCFVGMILDCALNLGVWNRILGEELTLRDVYRRTVPIFARGLRMC